MSGYTICLVAVLLGGLLPALVIAARGEPTARLVGLELVSTVIVFALILFSQVGPGQGYDLTLPLVLAPLSFAGTLVFTRLLGRHGGEQQ
ncbi:MAG: hypothetical protein ACYCO3_05155 [Mycobacteriales bacterium]